VLEVLVAVVGLTDEVPPPACGVESQAVAGEDLLVGVAPRDGAGQGAVEVEENSSDRVDVKMVPRTTTTLPSTVTTTTVMVMAK